MEGDGEAFAGLALDLAEAPAAEMGFVVFFLGASLAAFSAPEDFRVSLLSSFLGEAGFFMDDPGLETMPGRKQKCEHNMNTLLWFKGQFMLLCQNDALATPWSARPLCFLSELQLIFTERENAVEPVVETS